MEFRRKKILGPGGDSGAGITDSISNLFGGGNAVSGIPVNALAKYGTGYLGSGIAGGTGLTANALGNAAGGYLGTGGVTAGAGTGLTTNALANSTSGYLAGESAALGSGAASGTASGVGLGTGLMYSGIAAAMIPVMQAISGSGTGGWGTKLKKVLQGGDEKASSRINSILSGDHSWSQEGDTPYVIASLVNRGVLSEDDPRVQQYISNVIKKPSTVSFRPDASWNQGKDNSWTQVPADEYGQWMWNKAMSQISGMNI